MGDGAIRVLYKDSRYILTSFKQISGSRVGSEDFIGISAIDFNRKGDVMGYTTSSDAIGQAIRPQIYLHRIKHHEFIV